MTTPSVVVKASTLLIRGYRYFISPLLGNHCRFNPSCSEYAQQALIQHGFIRGTILSIRRVLRCNPWCDGGEDPVPVKKSN